MSTDLSVEEVDVNFDGKVDQIHMILACHSAQQVHGVKLLAQFDYK